MTCLFLGILIGIVLAIIVYPIVGILLDWFTSWVTYRVSIINKKINNLGNLPNDGRMGFLSDKDS